RLERHREPVPGARVRSGQLPRQGPTREPGARRRLRRPAQLARHTGGDGRRLGGALLPTVRSQPDELTDSDRRPSAQAISLWTVQFTGGPHIGVAPARSMAGRRVISMNCLAWPAVSHTLMSRQVEPSGPRPAMCARHPSGNESLSPSSSATLSYCAAVMFGVSASTAIVMRSSSFVFPKLSVGVITGTPQLVLSALTARLGLTRARALGLPYETAPDGLCRTQLRAAAVD